jgi:hypothetical protein
MLSFLPFNKACGEAAGSVKGKIYSIASLITTRINLGAI